MIDIILLQGKVLLRKEILQNDDKKQTLPSRGAPGAGNEAAERVGDGPRFFGGHLLLFMAEAPAVGVDDIAALRIVAVDDAHVGAEIGVGTAFLACDGQNAPAERHTVVDAFTDELDELLIIALVAHSDRGIDLRIERAEELAELEGFGFPPRHHEIVEFQPLLLELLGGGVVLFAESFDTPVGEQRLVLVMALEPDAQPGVRRFERVDHCLERGSGIRVGGGELGDHVLVDVRTVVAQNTFDGRRDAVPFPALVNHRNLQIARTGGVLFDLFRQVAGAGGAFQRGAEVFGRFAGREEFEGDVLRLFPVGAAPAQHQIQLRRPPDVRKEFGAVAERGGLVFRFFAAGKAGQFVPDQLEFLFKPVTVPFSGVAPVVDRQDHRTELLFAVERDNDFLKRIAV